MSNVHREGPLLYQTVEYDAGERGIWRMQLDGRYVLSDEETLADRASAGLRLDHRIDERRRWLAARAT